MLLLPSLHWNKKHYQESGDRSEVDLDSYTNRLTSVILCTPLLYPVSVSNFPGPERGIFCILIVDLIYISALECFSLLLARNYHYNKGRLKFEFIKFKTVHSRLLFIAVLQSILLLWVMKIVLISIITSYTWRGTFSAIVHWSTTIPLFLSYFIFNCHGTLFISINTKSVILWYYWKQQFCRGQRNL